MTFFSVMNRPSQVGCHALVVTKFVFEGPSPWEVCAEWPWRLIAATPWCRGARVEKVCRTKAAAGKDSPWGPTRWLLQ